MAVAEASAKPKYTKLFWISLSIGLLLGLITLPADRGTTLLLVVLVAAVLVFKRRKDYAKAQIVAGPSEVERQDRINAAERQLRLVQSAGFPPTPKLNDLAKWIAGLRAETERLTKTLEAAELVTDEDIQVLQSFRDRLRLEILTPADGLLTAQNFKLTDRQREQSARGIAVIDSFAFPASLTEKAVFKRLMPSAASLNIGPNVHHNMGGADFATIAIKLGMGFLQYKRAQVKLRKEAEQLHGEIALYRTETAATVDTLFAVRQQLMRFREQISECASKVRDRMAKLENMPDAPSRQEDFIWLSMYTEQLRRALDMRVV